MKYLILFLTLVLASCHSHDHEEGGHDHGAEDHSHGEIDDHEIPSIDATAWTDKIEFFVDFPALVTAQPSRFAVHITRLDGYHPLATGSLTVSLNSVEGATLMTATSDHPIEPGIFTPTIQPASAGVFQLVFDFKGEDLDEKIIVDDIRVYANSDEAIHDLEAPANSSAITFLKEQAWKIDFATAPALKGEIYDVVYSSGVWKTAPGAIKSIIAPVSGIVEFRSGKLTDGVAISKGQQLLSISSDQLTTNNLSVEVDQALSVFEQAEAEYERKKELYASRIIPKSELEEIESKYKIAKSKYESLLKGYSSGKKIITAPFSGYIKSVDINNGDFATEGKKLISLATDRSKILESHVSPTYAVSEEDIRNIWYQPMPGHWSSLNETGGSVLSVSEQVSPDHPMAAVFAQVNEEVKMPAGGFSEVQIALGSSAEGIVIPETALLEDYGNFSVIVQLSGESFERRPIKTGRRNGDQVEVVQGLKAGEFVVTQGAYQVKMASMSGELPAHGHAH